MLGRNVVDLPCSRDARRHYPIIRQALKQHGTWQGDLVEARANGELYTQWLQMNVVRDARGNVSQIVGFFADLNRTRVVSGKSVSVSVDLGGPRQFKKKI